MCCPLNFGNPGLTRNMTSLLGAILAAIGFANIVFLFLMAFFSRTAFQSNDKR
jgi:hypothetical protein